MDSQRLIFRIIDPNNISLPANDNIEMVIIDDGVEIGEPITLGGLLEKTGSKASMHFYTDMKRGLDFPVLVYYINIISRSIKNSEYGEIFSVYTENQITMGIEIKQHKGLDYMDIIIKSQYITNTFQPSR